MKRTPIVTALVILCLYSACYGIDLTQEIKTQGGFTLRVPDTWKPIPRDMLNAYSHAVAQLAPNTEKQTYDYGFQLAAAPEWFTYPYILVQVKKTGRVPEAQLKSIKQLQGDLDKSIAGVKNAMSDVVSDVSLGETVYDPTSHILFSRMRMDVKEIGSIHGLVAVLLTEEGIIQIAGYAKADDFSEYLPVFEKIARGVRLEDNLQYRSRMLDSIPIVGGIDWGRVLISALIGGAVGAVGTFVATVVRKRKASR